MPPPERVAALARHLDAGAAAGADGPRVQDASQRPAPGGGAGTLTVTDSRTGRSYALPISARGTLRGADLGRITAGGDGAGLRLYDPGYVNTAACVSRVCYIDGGAGVLRYRGVPIEHLAERSTYLETAYLVLFGALPAAPELARWEAEVGRHAGLPAPVAAAVGALPPDAHPMACLLAGLAALSACHPEQNPAIAGQAVYSSRAVRDKQVVRLVAKMPGLAALAYHKSTGRSPTPPTQALPGTAASLLFQIDAGGRPDYRPHPRLARALDVLFILHAEHELNCSTAAARHLASSGADVYTCVLGATGALAGPLHGGANEAVLRMLARVGSVAAVPAFLEGVKAKKEKLFGFGHRVYKSHDPRARVVRAVADDVFALCGRDPLIDVALALEAAARADDYFVSRRLYPNVDFFSGLAYRAMGFPPAFFTVLFAVPRVAGWLAHWREAVADPDARIARPQQDYAGEWLRPYVPLEERGAGAAGGGGGGGGDALGPVPPSAAYVRRTRGAHWR